MSLHLFITFITPWSFFQIIQKETSAEIHKALETNSESDADDDEEGSRSKSSGSSSREDHDREEGSSE